MLDSMVMVSLAHHAGRATLLQLQLLSVLAIHQLMKQAVNATQVIMVTGFPVLCASVVRLMMRCFPAAFIMKISTVLCVGAQLGFTITMEPVNHAGALIVMRRWCLTVHLEAQATPHSVNAKKGFSLMGRRAAKSVHVKEKTWKYSLIAGQAAKLTVLFAGAK